VYLVKTEVAAKNKADKDAWTNALLLQPWASFRKEIYTAPITKKKNAEVCKKVNRSPKIIKARRNENIGTNPP